MRSLLLVPIIFLSMLTLAAQAAADTRYVTDQLVITLRQGEGSQYKILKTLKTGTPIDVLSAGDTYLKVRTEDNTEGYVLRQYVSQDPPGTLRVEQLENQNNRLQEKLSELEKTKDKLQGQLEEVQEKYVRESSELTGKSSDLARDLEQARADERAMTEKYNALEAASQDIVQTVEERDRLRKEKALLLAEFKELQVKNEKIADSRMIKWFLAGAGVFFLGWLIGKISRKKRHRY